MADRSDSRAKIVSCLVGGALMEDLVWEQVNLIQETEQPTPYLFPLMATWTIATQTCLKPTHCCREYHNP